MNTCIFTLNTPRNFSMWKVSPYPHITVYPSSYYQGYPIFLSPSAYSTSSRRTQMVHIIALKALHHPVSLNRTYSHLGVTLAFRPYSSPLTSDFTLPDRILLLVARLDLRSCQHTAASISPVPSPLDTVRHRPIPVCDLHALNLFHLDVGHRDRMHSIMKCKFCCCRFFFRW